VKICRYKNPHYKGQPPRLGILYKNFIIDPHLSWVAEYEREGKFNPWERASYKSPSSLSKILTLIEDPFETIQEGFAIFLFLERLGIKETSSGIPLSYLLDSPEKMLVSPLDSINSFRDFFSYEEHAKKAFQGKLPSRWYEGPIYFRQSHNSFIGTNQTIPWPVATQKLDFEIELGLVIGQEGKNITRHSAKNHIFGLTIINDISARDIQKKEWELHLGPSKSKDFCTIIGPVITTLDEFGDFDHIPSLEMEIKLNGKVLSKGHAQSSKYGLSELICHASRDEWLLPTDLLGLGSMGAGSGFELKKRLSPNDILELNIEGIGSLRNKVGRQQEEKEWEKRVQK
jgi:2-keto-4-pentenoate hydratase/2-oxohepta-3-ene-1,7-dioic acid hydratase in catechol pathway